MDKMWFLKYAVTNEKRELGYVEINLLSELLREYEGMLFSFDRKNDKDFWRHRFRAESLDKKLRKLPPPPVA